MPELNYHSEIHCPDAFRDGNGRIYQGEKVRGLPYNFPRLTDRAGVKVPALLEIRGLCRQRLAPDKDGLVRGLWSIYAGPNHRQIDAKMMDEETVADHLRPLCDMLLELGAERASSWQYFYSGIHIEDAHGVKKPLVCVAYSQRPASMIEHDDEKIMAKRLWLPLVYNTVMEKFPSLSGLGLPEFWMPPGYQTDVWWEHPEIEEAIKENAEPLGKAVWKALLQHHQTANELADQGYKAVQLDRTRVGVRTTVRHNVANKHTRLLTKK